MSNLLSYAWKQQGLTTDLGLKYPYSVTSSKEYLYNTVNKSQIIINFKVYKLRMGISDHDTCKCVKLSRSC